MLIQDGCEACAEAKELFKDAIKKKEMVLLDAASEKGMELADKHEINSVPTIINKKGNIEQICFISSEGESMFCEDGTEKQLKS